MRMSAGVRKKVQRKQQKHAANSLVPNDARGPHNLWNDVLRELPGVADFDEFGRLYRVGKLHYVSC